ncbi:hypothetical protein MTO96_018647 [Rhipicephalus appendiculatus]
MCRAVAVPCDGEEDDQVHGRTRSSTSCHHLGVTGALLPVPPGQDRARDRARGRAKPRCCVPTGVRDSAREHEEADYVCRKQLPWPNSWVNDRDSTRPQRPPSYGIGRLTPSTRRPRRLPQTV